MVGEAGIHPSGPAHGVIPGGQPIGFRSGAWAVIAPTTSVPGAQSSGGSGDDPPAECGEDDVQRLSVVVGAGVGVVVGGAVPGTVVDGGAEVVTDAALIAARSMPHWVSE